MSLPLLNDCEFIGVVNFAASVALNINTPLLLNLSSTNVGYGNNATNPSVVTGTENTAVGSQALNAVTTGNNNTVLGFIAGAAITTGGNNTAVGRRALQVCQTGSGNVAIGDRALLNNISSNNVAIGTEAMTNASGGSAHQNVCIGVWAGRNLVAGSNSVYIGGFNQGTASITGATSVGYGGGCTSSFATTLGNGSLAAGVL